jgi:uncharacterized membrane protein YeiH
VPIVFVKELYASASFVGVLAFYILLSLGAELYMVTIASMVITTILRLVAMKYNWNLPKVREKI